MDRTVTLTTPLDKDRLAALRAGDMILLSGTVYAARDTAHRRIVESLDRGEEAPFPLTGSVIYYVGPTPPPPGRVIGAAGPTTAYRMDAYAPRLYELGLAASIGKGKRSPELRDCLRRCGGVYLGATAARRPCFLATSRRPNSSPTPNWAPRPCVVWNSATFRSS